MNVQQFLPLALGLIKSDNNRASEFERTADFTIGVGSN